MYPVPASRPFCASILIIVNFDLCAQRKAPKLLNAYASINDGGGEMRGIRDEDIAVSM